MIGAEALLRTLVSGGVDVCFTNPGTSEMHLVAALDRVPEMRGVLTLFEGVATGAADGYGRITGRPGSALLHLGPGLANGVANLHNARRAGTPLVCLVGDHATGHARYDAPLQSDIVSIARAVSGWVHVTGHQRELGADAAAAVRAACAGHVATLVVPADVSWGDGARPASTPPPPARAVPDADAVAAIAELLRRGEPTVLFLGDTALDEDGLRTASRIAKATGARLVAETFPRRMRRGAGVPDVPRLAYFAEQALDQLAGVRHLVLVGARPPVAFFAYPDRPSDLVPDGCELTALARPGGDAAAALTALADELGASSASAGLAESAAGIEDPSGALDIATLAAAIGATLPEDAVLVDEAITSGAFLPHYTAGAAPHDVLTLTGGAIGQGLPAATGAAIAAPHRKVVCVEADGSAAYTIQALWTQAREQLDVTTVLVNNGAYAILRMEMQRVGGTAGGERSKDVLDLRRPDLDFVSLARGFGVPAVRVEKADELVRQLRTAVAEPGPHLVEALVPPVV